MPKYLVTRTMEEITTLYNIVEAKTEEEAEEIVSHDSEAGLHWEEFEGGQASDDISVSDELTDEEVEYYKNQIDKEDEQ